MIRKLFTLPDELGDKLNRERNQSATVAEALTLYYEHKETVRKLAENTGKILEKLSTPVYQGISQQIQDEELTNKRQAYGEDGWLFRRHYTGELQANKPPSREWVDASLVNY